MLDLRVGEHLIDRIDRPARHPGFVEALDPVGTGTLRGQLVDFRIESVAILQSIGAICVLRPGDQLRRLERVAETLPDLLAGSGDVDVAIGRFEDTGRNASGVIVAGLFGDLTFHKPARRLEIEHEDLSLQQGRFDLLTLAGLFPLEERNKDARGAKYPRRQVGDRYADPHRPLPGLAGDRHQAAHALGDLIEARALRVGAVLAEARNARIDKARIDLAQRLVVDAEP